MAWALTMKPRLLPPRPNLANASSPFLATGPLLGPFVSNSRPSNSLTHKPSKPQRIKPTFGTQRSSFGVLSSEMFYMLSNIANKKKPVSANFWRMNEPSAKVRHTFPSKIIFKTIMAGNNARAVSEFGLMEPINSPAD